MTKPAPAAASIRCSINGHGLRLSDSEIAQKSWPSGAPIRAATASIAVMPGMIATSSARQLSGPASISSQIAAAHHGDARALRRVTERGGGACALLTVVRRVAVLAGAHRHAVEIGSVAVKRFRSGE